MASATLYDDDILTWSEQHAAALRALAERPDLSNAGPTSIVADAVQDAHP